MNALIPTVNPVTMSSLELVMGSLMAKPVKGYDWYCQAFEVIDTCPGLAGFPSLKSALIGSVCSAYQDRIKSSLLTHKVTTVSRSDGTEKIVEQVLVTAKGLAKLAEAAA